MIELKLDTQAMDKLFPEGTTARVNLQSSIIASLAGRFLKPGAELQKVLNEHKKTILNESLADYGMKSSTWGGGYELTGMAKSRLKDECSVVVRDMISAQIKEAITEQIGSIDSIVERRVTYEIDQMVKDRVTKRLKEITAAL